MTSALHTLLHYYSNHDTAWSDKQNVAWMMTALLQNCTHCLFIHSVLPYICSNITLIPTADCGCLLLPKFLFFSFLKCFESYLSVWNWQNQTPQNSTPVKVWYNVNAAQAGWLIAWVQVAAPTDITPIKTPVLLLFCRPPQAATNV